MLRFCSFSGNEYLYSHSSNKIYPASAVTDDMTEREERIEIAGPPKNWLANQKAGTLILNITDACNLRCSYCAYSDYYPYERGHGQAVMSFDVARAAITAYKARNPGKPNIALYGGEPLLARSLIQKIVNFAKSEFRTIEFSLNTNATSLSAAWADFLALEDIQLQISLDGNRDTHDAFRVDKAGRGTHGKVMTNLRSLHDRHKEYFRRAVTFIATMAPPYGILDLYHFYNENEVIRGQGWFINYVNPLNTNFFDNHGGEGQFKKYDAECLLIANDYIDKCIAGGSAGHFGQWLFGGLLYKIHQRSMNPNAPAWINGSCVPGIDKLFVTTQGEYSACERAGDFMPMGDIESGLNSADIEKIVFDYTKDAEQNCAACPNSRFCDTCYLATRDGDIQNLHQKYKYCGRRLSKLQLHLYIYASVLEKNQHGFDDLWMLLAE